MTSLKTGLFSVIVGGFIIEFYKKLSPDTSGQTVDLLRQISQQLANLPSGNYSNATIQSPPPSVSVVWVNAMWMISLVLSLTSALMATLLQQWARRYIKKPKVPSELHDCARVHWFLSQKKDFYNMRLMVEIAPILLHLSVYLFFAGLVINFHTINHKVAIAVDVSVGLFGLVYILLTILPCADVGSPYRTPMSYILWCLYHGSFSFTARCLHWLVSLFYECFDDFNPEGTTRDKLDGWSTSCENTAERHWLCVIRGFGQSILDSANGLIDGDHKIITWLFSQLALHDNSKLQRLAACMPRDSLLSIIRRTGESDSQESFLTLLRSLVISTHSAYPNQKDVRKRYLLACLNAIHDIAKEPIPDDSNSFDLDILANIPLMRTLWRDSDTTIRVLSRSICALIAKQVLRKFLPSASELGWLEKVIGEPPNRILDDRRWMNLKSFINGVLADLQVKDDLPVLPAEDVTSFKETLAILLDVGADVDFDTNFQTRLSAEVGEKMTNNDDVANRNKLILIFPFLQPPPIQPPPLPPSSPPPPPPPPPTSVQPPPPPPSPVQPPAPWPLLA